jgi:hypothetical protein
MPHHANQTSFRPGPDPRRHLFTTEERARGYRTTMDRAAEGLIDPVVGEWVRRRVRSRNRRRRRLLSSKVSRL